MTADLRRRIDLGRTTVLAQTELMHRDFGRVTSQWKYDGTRVTTADVAISQAIQADVKAAFPEDTFLSEELLAVDEPVAVTSTFSWVLDPIDGTNNYALGLAHCAIALALLQDGVPIYGWVYDLSRRRLLHGGPGIGLWDGESAAAVRPGSRGAQSLLGFHSPYDKAYGQQARQLVESFKIRALGSSTLHLAYVAVGILDATVDHNVKVWDIAAAVPLVWAGGGEVTFLSESPFPLRLFNLRMPRIQYLAGNATLVGEIRALLQV